MKVGQHQISVSGLASVLFVLLFQFSLQAETVVKPTGAAAPRKQTVDFEDELVEGELKKPELFYLLQKKQFNYKRMIKLRENFSPEMVRDAEKIPVGRGQ